MNDKSGIVILAEETLLAEIRRWHEEDRRTGVRQAFALGDLIVKAVIHTGKTEYDIIRRIIEHLGDMAYGITTYNRAARLVRVFTANQREVLIDNAVSLAKCEILAGEMYEGRKRVKMINEIKSGKVAAPWKQIRGCRYVERQAQVDALTSDNPPEAPRQSWNNISIPVIVDGKVDEPAFVSAMKLAIVRIGKMKVVELVKQAVDDIEAREVKK